MANNNHATKADLNALRDEQSELTLRESMQAVRGGITAALDEMETNVLRVFFDIAETNELRLRQNEEALAGLTDLIATLDRRITDLEKRVNFPNAS